MNKNNQRLNQESPIEQRLRAEASAWAKQVQQQDGPHVELNKSVAVESRSSRTAAWSQWNVLTAAVVLLAAGLTWWNWYPAQSDSETQIAMRPVASASAEDLATLRATNHAIQKVFGSAAQTTRTAVGRRLDEVNQISLTGDSLKLADASGETVRQWAREPGRQYLAAAQWLNGRLDLLGDSSLTAAKRLLGQQNSLPPESTDG